MNLHKDSKVGMSGTSGSGVFILLPETKGTVVTT